MVSAGTEHERFTDLFPFWEVSRTVQELNCKVRLFAILLDHIRRLVITSSRAYFCILLL